MTAAESAVDAETVAAIAALPPTLMRNHLVTLTYHQLAAAFRPLLGSGSANWFDFGTWASLSVGSILSGQVLPEPARRLLVGSGDQLGDGHHRVRLLGDLEATASDVAVSLAEGNVLVFAEVAPAALAFLAAHTDTSEADRSAAAAELNRRVAVPPVVLGQRRLSLGFDAFASAIGEPEKSRRAQLVLAGSLQFLAEEQFRLEPFVSQALDAALTVAFRRLADRVIMRGLGRIPPVAWAARQAAAATDHLWDEAMTRYFLVVAWPGERVHLGRDVAALPDRSLIPPALAPPWGSELESVFSEFDRTGGTSRHDASIDWADFGSRMNWLSWFFLSRSFDDRLLRPPFAPDQVRLLGRQLASLQR
jgi:hypothetical protein